MKNEQGLIEKRFIPNGKISLTEKKVALRRMKKSCSFM
jgi:hypothetical protein